MTTYPLVTPPVPISPEMSFADVQTHFQPHIDDVNLSLMESFNIPGEDRTVSFGFAWFDMTNFKAACQMSLSCNSSAYRKYSGHTFMIAFKQDNPATTVDLSWGVCLPNLFTGGMKQQNYQNYGGFCAVVNAPGMLDHPENYHFDVLTTPTFQPPLTTMHTTTDGTSGGTAFALQKADGGWTPTSSVYYPSFSAPVQAIGSSPIYVVWMLLDTETGKDIIQEDYNVYSFASSLPMTDDKQVHTYQEVRSQTQKKSPKTFISDPVVATTGAISLAASIGVAYVLLGLF